MGAEYVEGFSEDVVVDETSIDRAAAHHQDDVATTKKYLEDLRILDFLLQSFLLQNHEES